MAKKNKNKRRNSFAVVKKNTPQSKKEVKITEPKTKVKVPKPDNKKPEPKTKPNKVETKVEKTKQQKTVSVVETKNIADKTPVEELVTTETVKVSQTEKTENKTIKDDQVEKIPVIILVESEGDRELSRQERVKKRKPMTDEEFIQKHNNKIAQLLCIMDKSIIFNSENFTKGLRAGIDRIVEYKGAEYSIFVTKSFDQGSRDVIAHIIDNDDWVPEFNSENKCINLPTGENTERIRLSFDSKKEDSAADLGYHFVVELAKTSKLKNFLKYFLTLHMTRLGIETLNGHPGLSNKRTEVSIVETENVKDKELV